MPCHHKQDVEAGEKTMRMIWMILTWIVASAMLLSSTFRAAAARLFLPSVGHPCSRWTKNESSHAEDSLSSSSPFGERFAFRTIPVLHERHTHCFSALFSRAGLHTWRALIACGLQPNPHHNGEAMQRRYTHPLPTMTFVGRHLLSCAVPCDAGSSFLITRTVADCQPHGPGRIMLDWYYFSRYEGQSPALDRVTGSHVVAACASRCDHSETGMKDAQVPDILPISRPLQHHLVTVGSTQRAVVPDRGRCFETPKCTVECLDSEVNVRVVGYLLHRTMFAAKKPCLRLGHPIAYSPPRSLRSEH